MNNRLLEKYKEFTNIDYTQDFVDIADISNGFIFLNDGSVVKILELMPINYSERNDETKDTVADIFGLNYKLFPRNGQLKIMDAKANLDSFINKMEECITKEKEPRVIERIHDYIEHVKTLQKENSRKKRFFYIFSYEGDAEEKKSSDFEEVIGEMWNQMTVIANAFASTGNYVLNADGDNMYEAEILYSFFNPSSVESEGIDQRIKSVNNAMNALKSMGTIKVPSTIDYIAPRGIQAFPWDTIAIDGVFHTYLALRDNSYPLNAYAGWLSEIMEEAPGCDIDIHTRKEYKETTMYLLDRATLIRRGSAGSYTGDRAKQEELLTKANNSQYILNLLQKKDEELYSVTIIITLKAPTLKELRQKKAIFLKNMRRNSFYFDDCFMQTQNYFKMAMPLNYKVRQVCKANSRNMTNSSLSSLYCLSTYEMFDPAGWVMGTLAKNGTLFAFNTFNKSIFSNPFIFIAGKPGSGKTYSELMFASRMRMSGIKTIFVLPLKGHEYKDAVTSMGGSYIPLFPGASTCLNIMEIRPEGMSQLDDSLDDEVRNELAKLSSLRAKKTASIITWLTLLIGTEIPYEVEGEINVAIGKIYDRFGITDDNDSIWEDKKKGILKKMPILSDLKEELEKIPSLSKVVSMLKTWTEGNCSNMNGQTNVDLNSMSIAFDINEDAIGPRFLPAFMYIAFDMAYDIAKANLDERCAIFLDEIWKLLVIPTCGQQIFKLIKIIRAYNTTVVSATQDIEDCQNNEYGRSILTLSETKIFLKASKEEIDQLSRSVNISAWNATEIMGLPIGTGFIFFNNERLKVNFQASDLEEETYTPGEKAKAKIRERRQVNRGLTNN